MIVHKRSYTPTRISQVMRIESGCLEVSCVEPMRIIAHPQNLVALTDPASVVAEKFRALAIKLRNFQKRQRLKKLLVTSSVKGEGKSVISANVALTLAQAQRTLLIDCDLHQSGLQDVLGSHGQIGIAEWSRQSDPASSFLRRMDGLPLWYLSAGQCSGAPSEILQSDRFAEALNQFSRLFDWIVLDSPPLIPVADSSALAIHADATLLVVRQGITPKPLHKEALKTEHLNLLGIIANEWEGAERSYYSQYYAGYGSKRLLAAVKSPQLPSSVELES